MPTVFDDIKSPDATPDAVVTITLVGADSAPVQGYVSASDYSVAGVLQPDVVGSRWEADLPANSTIKPTGTVWKISTRLGPVTYTSHITVPVGAGPFFVEDILTDPPTAITPIPLQEHLVDILDAHAASAVKVTPVGALVAVNAQAALAELDADLTTEAVARVAGDAARVLTSTVGQVGGPAGPLNAQGQLPAAQNGTTGAPATLKGFVAPGPCDQAASPNLYSFVANQAVLTSFYLEREQTISFVLWRLTTNDGNYDLGIYDDDGVNGAPLTRLASTGSFVLASTGGKATPLGPITLAPGRYYVAFSGSGAVGNMSEYRDGAWGVLAMGNASYIAPSSFPLPATMVGAVDQLGTTGKVYLLQVGNN